MSQRTDFQVQVIEKLGAPLLAAVSDVAARQAKGGQDGQKQEAEQVAALLNKAVQMSIRLAETMDLKDADGQTDAIRLALAAVSGPVIAGQYQISGKVPGDNEVGRLVKALEAVLTFSDNFVPAAENSARLENVKPGMVFADENQVNVQAVYALVPVVGVVASFPFGRPENKLVQEVSGRLVKQAETLASRILSGASVPDTKRGELKILEALAFVYAECHRAEMGKLTSMDDAARAKLAESSGGVLPMDDLWKAFDLRVAMMEIVGKSVLPESVSAAPAVPAPETAPAPVEMAPAAAAPIEEVVVTAQPEAEAAPAQEPVPQDEEDDEEDELSGPYNPMGFFKPKDNPADGDESREDV